MCVKDNSRSGSPRFLLCSQPKINCLCLGLARRRKTMMNTKKSLLLSLAFSCLSAMAGVPGVTFLFTNGQKASFTFASKPEIAVGDNGITISSSNSASVSYTFANVHKFYFEDDVVDAGIKDVKTTSATYPVFNCNNGVITVSGLKASERVSVYSIGGSKVVEAKANNDGKASIDISDAAKGAYVVSTGSGVSFKLLKK